MSYNYINRHVVLIQVTTLTVLINYLMDQRSMSNFFFFVGHFGLMLNIPILFLSLGQFHGRIYDVSYKTDKHVMSLELFSFSP